MARRRTATALVWIIAGGWLAVTVAALHAGGQQPSVQARLPTATPAPAAFFQQYCFACHNQRLRTAGLALDVLDLSDVSARAETWERVIEKLRAETMPPAGRPRPDRAAYQAQASWLEGEIDRVAAVAPDPGRTETFHRLNRVEYQHAVRDLLALDVDVASLLPADNTYEHGFDNNGEVLSTSPELLARYLSVARRVSRLAVGAPPASPVVDTYRVHPGLLQDDRVSEALPLGSRGGIAVRHYFPVDGEYVVRIRLHRNFSDYVLGFGSSHELDVRLDGVRLARFSVGGEGQGRMAPLSFAGNIDGDPGWEYYMNTGDAGLEVRFTAKAGPRLVGVSFLRKMMEPDGVLQPRNRGYGRFVDEQYDGYAAVEQVTIGGPYRIDGPGDTPSRREIFVCRPSTGADEESCASRILSTLARRAYRRQVADEDVRTLLDFYRAGRREGSFDTGIQFALERILVDPEFLFRIERDPADLPPGTPYRLSDVELASRLSFFLWSSIPDDALLDVAIRGELKDPAVLERQVRRMLDDPRARALVENFAGQWLRLRNLREEARESAEFPEFDENLREAFREETERFVESTIREDRSVVELLSANYTFVNERLARHYGIPNVYGDRFRRVTLGPEHPRGGLLGHGSLLMVTSYPNRTSPVVRGKWLLEAMLGAPPPEPPPNVPGLPDRGEDGRPASVRERLEQHRENAVCAACHAPMDPLGFALENFDPIGTWRTVSEAGTPIDAGGRMPNGTEFDGPAGLRELLVSRRDEFAANVASKLAAYAVGRGLQYYDRPSVRAIVRDAAPSDYRWSSIILGIVKSPPFQMRTTRTEGSTPTAAMQAAGR